MSDYQVGRLQSAQWVFDGATVSADVAVGALVLYVDDVGDFDESGGTLLIPDPTTLTGYQSIVYGPIADNVDTRLDLATACPIAVESGSEIRVLNDITGEPIRELEALVIIDEADDGDALPATVSGAVTKHVDSDFNTLVGMVVDLDVDEFGNLTIVDFPGTEPQEGTLQFAEPDLADTFPVLGPGTFTCTLTKLPIPDSLHLYWNGMWQPHSQWTRDARLVTFTDPSSLFEAGDLIGAKYAYIGTEQTPPTIYSAPTWNARNGQQAAHYAPTDPTGTVNLPTGTQAGDMLIVILGGKGGCTITDPRITTLVSAVNSQSAIGVGYAVAVGAVGALDPVAVSCIGLYDTVNQFSHKSVVAVRGPGAGVKHDPTKIVTGTVGGTTGVIPAGLAGAPNGTIVAMLTGWNGGSDSAYYASQAWATRMPNYTYWGRTDEAFMGELSGYSSQAPPPAQVNPSAATTTYALIGLR